MNWGQELKKLRLEQGHSLRSLGELADVDYSTLRKFENSKGMRTTIALAERVAKALGYELDLIRCREK